MATAFSPANISCIFRPYEDSDPKKTGSLGVGFTVNKGVTVSVSKAPLHHLLFNYHNVDMPTVESVLDMLTHEGIYVSIESELPLGVGFGLSGACALATAYAVNDLLKLRKSNHELAMIAHVAEVNNKTGLGDVCGQFNGGFQMKTKIGHPLVSERKEIDVKTIYCDIFSALETKSVLSNTLLKEKIMNAGELAVMKIAEKKKLSFKELCRLSNEFAESSGLLSPEAHHAIMTSNANTAMMMLGNAIYSDSPKGMKNPITLQLSQQGAHLL